MTTTWYPYARDVVRAVGPDAGAYLHSQLSQDVASIAVGESRWSFVLEPTGKVCVLARVWRRGDDEYVLDTDSGFGEAMLARLNRFRIRVAVDLEPVGWTCLAVHPGEGVDGGLPSWGGGVDLLGPAVAPPPGAVAGPADGLEALRVAAAWPRMGYEITEQSIPAETGVVPVAVSFTKGCYPGQELVERMDSRGATAPRRLVRIVAGAGTTPGTALVVDGEEVGTITSVAGPYALALVRRSAELPEALTA